MHSAPHPFELIVNSLPELAMIATDADGRIVDWNPGAHRLFGWYPDDAIGESIQVVFPVQEAQEAWRSLTQRADATGMCRLEGWRRRRNGSQFWALTSVVPINDPQGRVSHGWVIGDRSDERRAREALHEANERLSLSLEAGAVLGSWVWDVSLDVLRGDGRLAELFSVDPDAMAVGLPIDRFMRAIHPEDIGQVEDGLNQAMRQGGPFRIEYRLTPGGRTRWVEVVGRVDMSESGQAIRVPGVLIDITERRRLEQELHSADERLKRALDAGTPVGTWSYAPASGLLRGDERFARIFAMSEKARAMGLAPAALLGARAEDAASAARFGERLARGEAFDTTLHWVGADGPRWVQIAGRRVRGEGTMPDIEGTALDITALKLVEDSLLGRTRSLEERAAVSEARLRVLFENTPDMLFLCRVEHDGEVVIDAGNPAFMRFHGRSVDQASNVPLEDLFSGEVLDVVRKSYLECITENRTVRHEVDITIHGVHKIAESTLMPLPVDAQASHRLVLGTARDVTAHRALEAQLRQSQKMEAVGQLTGGLAHDFNNVLQIIAGNLQLLRVDTLGNAAAQRRLDAAEAALRQGGRTAMQLLTFARKRALEPTLIDVAELVHGMEDLFRHALGSRIEVVLDLPERLGTLSVDRSQLENALLNLAINARDAMNGAGRLTLAARDRMVRADMPEWPGEVAPGPYQFLSIADTGAGMSPEVLSHVFEPFFTTKPEGRGTGLGLSMVYGFVKQSGGHVLIDSAPGVGTTVTLCLPVAAPQAAQAAGGSETLLLVARDEALRARINEALNALGYRILRTHDARSALTIVKSGLPIDLMLVIDEPSADTQALANAAKDVMPALAVLGTSAAELDDSASLAARLRRTLDARNRLSDAQ